MGSDLAGARPATRAVALATALLLAVAARARGAEPVDAQVAAARDAVYPALVNITVVSQSYGDGRAMRYPAAGSGVIVSPQGHVLTNYHVAGQAVRVECTLTTGEVYEAEVVVHDPLTDLSVLKLRPRPRDGQGRSFPFARLGDSDALEVGEPVLAMGNPLALSSSVTRGIVSNPHRVFTDFLGSSLADLDLGDGQPTGIFTRWIQHDALILPGNSGGPLVDLAGEVIGINELGGGGIGFAIPAKVAAFVLHQGIKRGEVRRSWLGMSFLPVEKLGRETGALVSDVLAGSPAEEAGVRPGDVVLRLAGEPTDVRFLEQVPLLYQRIAALPVGEAVSLDLLRDGRPATLFATTELMGPALGREAEIRELGVTVRETTPLMALVHRYPNTEGLVVTGVRPGYPVEAAKPTISTEDQILGIDGRPVPTIAALERALAAGGGPDPHVLRVWSGGEEVLVPVHTGRKPPPQWGGELPQAWLGAKTQVLTPDLARALGLAGRSGFRVTEVVPWSAAGKAGLAVGDVLTSLDGEPLDASRPQDREDLRRSIERRTPGETIRLGLLRDGVARELAVTLDAKPEDAAEARKLAWPALDFSVRELTDGDRIAHRWDPDVQGVLVVEAQPGGWAQMSGLQLGDLVVAIDGQAVSSVKRFRAVVGATLAAEPKVIRLFLRRGYRTHFVFIEPDWSEIDGAAEAP